LVLTTSFPLPGGPPSGPFIGRLVENLPPNVEATVVTPCFGTRRDRDADRPYRLRCFRYAPRTWQRLAHVPGGIPAALRANRLLYLLLPSFVVCMAAACWRAAATADLIHANWSVNGVVAGVVARMRGIPLVTTLRGEDITRSHTSGLFRWLLQRCLRDSDRVVLVSRAFLDSIQQGAPGKGARAEVIPNGIHRGLLDEPIVSGSAGTLKLVAVGSLIPRKSVATLVRALGRMPDRARVTLTVVGDGPERAPLESLVESLALTDLVRFVGAVDPADVVGYLRASEVIVLCSLSEGRPNVVLEAMAAGTAVVATAIDGTTELVQDGETGLLFEPKDDAALAAHLEGLRSDPERVTRLARNARRWIVEQGLFWDTTGERYARTYREVLDGRA
jgi:glycosyltransferase involved in cell wall biosynthesis